MVVAHEIVHGIHSSKKPRVVLKRLMTKLAGTFLFEVLKTRKFSHVWINWMELLVKGACVGVKLNGEASSFFSPRKGLR